MNKEENQKKCIKINDEDENENTIQKDERGFYHIGKYSTILNHKEWIGKRVIILHSKENTNETTKKYYPYFVREEDYELLE